MDNKIEVWVITKFINEYDQEDEGYFMGVFSHTPTIKEIHDCLKVEGVSIDKATSLFNGGWGRKDNEYKCYELNSFKI